MVFAGPDVVLAIGALAVAVVFLALALIFGKALGRFLGIAAVTLVLTWIFAGLYWWTIILALVGSVVLTAVANYMDERRRQASNRPGMTDLDRYLADLKYQLDHGMIDEREYEQAVRAVTSAPQITNQ